MVDDQDSIRQSIGIFEFFFFNDTATTEIYTLSLHDALPIFAGSRSGSSASSRPSSGSCSSSSSSPGTWPTGRDGSRREDRKSTRLNSSHSQISYAVFCLNKYIRK